MLTIETLRKDDAGNYKGKGHFKNNSCIFVNNKLLIGTFPYCEEITIPYNDFMQAVNNYTI